MLEDKSNCKLLNISSNNFNPELLCKGRCILELHRPHKKQKGNTLAGSFKVVHVPLEESLVLIDFK